MKRNWTAAEKQDTVDFIMQLHGLGFERSAIAKEAALAANFVSRVINGGGVWPIYAKIDEQERHAICESAEHPDYEAMRKSLDWVELAPRQFVKRETFERYSHCFWKVAA